MAQHYPQETKQKVAQLKLQGYSLGEISNKLNIPRSSIQSILYANKIEQEQIDFDQQEQQLTQPSNIVATPKENYKIREYVQNFSMTDFEANSQHRLQAQYVILAFEKMENEINQLSKQVRSLEREIDAFPEKVKEEIKKGINEFVSSRR